MLPLDYINTPSSRDLAYSSLAGGAAGMSLYWLIQRMRNRKATLSGAVMSVFGGAAAGAAGMSTYRLFQGKQYDNSRFKPTGKKVYVGVSGAGDGQGSTLQNALNHAKGAENVLMFRHGDEAEATKRIQSLIDQGYDVDLWGHSWGGRTANRITRTLNNPRVHTSLVDPVSHTDNTPFNGVTVYNPDSASDYKYDFSNFIADVGHRWGAEGKTYHGGHSHGVGNVVLNAYNLPSETWI